jgi:hypothetical protein
MPLTYVDRALQLRTLRWKSLAEREACTVGRNTARGYTEGRMMLAGRAARRARHHAIHGTAGQSGAAEPIALRSACVLFGLGLV